MMLREVSLFLFKVLKGDIQPAIELHEMLYQVMQKHNFLPEVGGLVNPLKTNGIFYKV